VCFILYDLLSRNTVTDTFNEMLTDPL
jgi:hypothetical protein